MVKKIILLITFILLITACSKNSDVFVPEPGNYQGQSDFLKKVDVEVEAVSPPKPIPVVPIQEPAPKPVTKPQPAPTPVTPPPVEQIVPINTCTILKKAGILYTPADVQAGKISLDDYNDLRKCYPYFGQTQEDTQAVCCII